MGFKKWEEIQILNSNRWNLSERRKENRREKKIYIYFCLLTVAADLSHPDCVKPSTTPSLFGGIALFLGWRRSIHLSAVDSFLTRRI